MMNLDPQLSIASASKQQTYLNIKISRMFCLRSNTLFRYDGLMDFIGSSQSCILSFLLIV
jgi:hypothetical protein